MLDVVLSIGQGRGDRFDEGMYRRDPENDDLRGTQAAAHRSTVRHFEPLFSHRYEKVRTRSQSLAEIVRLNGKARRGEVFWSGGRVKATSFPDRITRFTTTLLIGLFRFQENSSKGTRATGIIVSSV